MSHRFSMRDPADRRRGLSAAADAVRRGELVVLPTDTVYGIGTDAFAPGAVTTLLKAKGRGGTCRCRFWSGHRPRSRGS